MLFQIFLVAFAAVAIYKTWRQYQARHVSKHWLIVFSCFWLAVALVAISPDTTSVVANMVGVGRGADLLVYLAVLVLFYMVYRLLVSQQRLSEEVTELVRKIAVQNAVADKAADTSAEVMTAPPNPPVAGEERQ